MPKRSLIFCKLTLSRADRLFRARQKWRMKNHLDRGWSWSPVSSERPRKPTQAERRYEDRLVRQRAQWLYLANQIPGCLEPARCKTGHWVRAEDYLAKERMCRPCRRAKTKAQRLRNPLSAKATRKRAKHRRKALLRGNGGSYTEEEWQSVLAAAGHRCVRCGASGSMTVDHILPLSRGGLNVAANIQPMCHLCNSRKGNVVTGAMQALIPGLLTHLHQSGR